MLPNHHMYRLFVPFFFLFIIAPSFGQSTESLDDLLADVVVTQFPKWSVRTPGTPFQGSYATTIVKLMHGEWVKGKGRFLRIGVSIVDSPEELKRQRSYFLDLRQIMPKSSPVADLGDKPVLLSTCTSVEIMFARENMLFKIYYGFRQGCYPPRPAYEVTAPKKEIETATQLARSLYAVVTRPRSMTPCDNDFLNPVFPRPLDTSGRMLGAALNGNNDAIISLLSAGVPTSVSDKDGNTPLHLAVYHGCNEVIQTIINAKADLNARNLRGETPLMVAANLRQVEAVRLLISAGSDMNAKDKFGLNAASHAASASRFLTIFPTPVEYRAEVQRLLRDAGVVPSK